MSVNISDYSFNEWVGLISSSKGQDLYIKNDQIQRFKSINEASEAGFPKLSLQQIIEISKEKISIKDDSEEFRKSIQSLERFFKRHISEITDTNMRRQFNTIASHFHTHPVETLVAMDSLMHANLISPDMSTLLQKQLKQATSVLRSERGVNGVYFLQLPDEPYALILKLPPEDPLQHVLADRFYQMLGYVTPNYGIIHCNTDLGKEAFQALRVLGNQFFSKNPDDYKFAKFNDQMKRSYMTIAKMIPGKPLSHLAKDVGKMLLQDTAFLEDLGELVFLDAVIGNDDRLFQANFGNCILLGRGVSDDKGRRIALIDHDYQINNTNLKYNLQVMQSLTEGDEVLLKIVGSLQLNFSADLDAAQILSSLKAGFSRGRERFLKTFADDASIDRLLDVPDHPNFKKPNRQLFVQMRNYVIENQRA